MFDFGDLYRLCEEEHAAEFQADPIFDTYFFLASIVVIGVPGIFSTKWFNEAVSKAASLDDVRVIVKTNMGYLRTMLTLDFKDFKSKNGRLFRHFGAWCTSNGLDLSVENTDKVTAFYHDQCVNATPRDANGHQAKTAMSILTSVFWFDKLRVYQGWSSWRLNHERVPGTL